MLSKEKMARINELGRKKKASQLTDAEAKEQAELRKEYLATFRVAMTGHISTLKIIDPEGNDVTPQKVKDLKKGLKLH